MFINPPRLSDFKQVLTKAGIQVSHSSILKGVGKNILTGGGGGGGFFSEKIIVAPGVYWGFPSFLNP